MIFYYGNQLRARGFSDREVGEASDARRKVWRLLSTGEGYSEARTALDRARSQRWFSVVNEQSDGLFSRPTSALLNDSALRDRVWFRREANYDPRSALRALSVPALFIFGEMDALVPVERSVAVIRETLTLAGRRDFSIAVFPRADHGMSVSSADGGRTLAARYLGAIEDWLRKTLS